MSAVLVDLGLEVAITFKKQGVNVCVNDSSLCFRFAEVLVHSRGSHQLVGLYLPHRLHESDLKVGFGLSTSIEQLGRFWTWNLRPGDPPHFHVILFYVRGLLFVNQNSTDIVLS